MRRQAVLAMILLAASGQTAEAFPWKKVAKAAFIWGAPIGTSLLATKGGIDCRARNGVEPCTAHYGEFKGTEISRGIFSFSMSAVTWKCLKETDWKPCYGIAGGTTAFNAYWFVHEERIHARKRE